MTPMLIHLVVNAIEADRHRGDRDLPVDLWDPDAPGARPCPPPGDEPTRFAPLARAFAALRPARNPRSARL